MRTEIVCLKGKLHDWGPRLEHAPAGVVYVGRQQSQGGWKLKASPFANPYRAQQVGGAAKAVKMYALWVAERPNLIAAAKAMLRGKQLACWCKADQPCHAAWLAAFIDGCVELPERVQPEPVDRNIVLFGNDMGGRRVDTVRLRGEAAVLL